MTWSCNTTSCVVPSVILAIIFGSLVLAGLLRTLYVYCIRKTARVDEENIELGNMAPQLNRFTWEFHSTATAPSDVPGRPPVIQAPAPAASRNNPYVYKPFMTKIAEREASNGAILNGMLPRVEVKVPTKIKRPGPPRSHTRDDQNNFINVPLND